MALAASISLTACSVERHTDSPGDETSIGRVDIFTIPFDEALRIRSATYTPSGKILVSYASEREQSEDFIQLAVMDDDGSNFNSFFARTIPLKPTANGICYMVFADNRRVFLGDYILECEPDLDDCQQPRVIPVEYPGQITGGEKVMVHWSEMIIAPDNRHVAWTTLLSDFSAVVFTGTLEKVSSGYRIVSPRIISTLEPFSPDPSTPGYAETTIFSPDERLGITMSTRFSETSNLAILGLLPRPYPATMDMGLSMFHYTHAVTGVRISRPGNIGPVLIDIARSSSEQDYQGINLNTEADWVFLFAYVLASGWEKSPVN